MKLHNLYTHPFVNEVSWVLMITGGVVSSLSLTESVGIPLWLSLAAGLTVMTGVALQGIILVTLVAPIARRWIKAAITCLFTQSVASRAKTFGLFFMSEVLQPKLGKLFLRFLEYRLKSYKGVLKDQEDFISEERKNSLKDAVNEDLKRYHRIKRIFNIPEENIDEKIENLREDVENKKRFYKSLLESLEEDHKNAKSAEELHEKEYYMKLADTLGEDLYFVSCSIKKNLKKIEKLKEKKHILKEE